MSKPVVAIVGRPNVGKSTFFNYIVGQRISIVEDTPGVTRDRVYAESNWRGRNFTVIDTAGIEELSGDTIVNQMREQVDIAISVADVILTFASDEILISLSEWISMPFSSVRLIYSFPSFEMIYIPSSVNRISFPPGAFQLLF